MILVWRLILAEARARRLVSYNWTDPITLSRLPLASPDIPQNNKSFRGAFMNSILRRLSATLALLAIAFCNQPLSAQEGPLRIGVITFLSGPAAGPFGV